MVHKNFDFGINIRKLLIHNTYNLSEKYETTLHKISNSFCTIDIDLVTINKI